jgi:hypothetical protein
MADQEIIRDRELQATQIARGQDVIYRETAHYMLSEAQFNTLVDPPPRSHQWLPNVRGAFVSSVLAFGVAALSQLAQGAALSRKTLWPFAAIVGVAALLWLGVYLRVRFGPDRQRDTIARIRRTWDDGA